MDKLLLVVLVLLLLFASFYKMGLRKSLIAVFVLSMLFAFFFAVGGAGIYGSPFAPVPANFPSQSMNHLLMALTILVGPLACGVALALNKGAHGIASLVLVLGAIVGAVLGMTTSFAYVWEWVFVITVWLPMICVAVWNVASPRRS